MVSITHSGENIFRLNKILETAQKHFNRYGLEKSTMREIAADLNISKGALYYYFPDKEQLYIAVVEKELDEFAQLVTEKLAIMTDPEEMLKEYIQIRMAHFRKMLNLTRFRMEDFRTLKPIMGDSWCKFQGKEEEIIANILYLGIKEKKFFIGHPEETAQLFLDLVKGLRRNELQHKELFYLEEDEYAVLVKKTSDFIDIFIRGLKYH